MAGNSKQAAPVEAIVSGPKAEAILIAAARLFRENGYAATSMEDIGRTLGMNKGTLYYYVQSKEQLLYFVILRATYILELVREIAADRSLPPPDRLRKITEAHLAFTAANWDVFCVMTRDTDHLEPDHQRAIKAVRRDYTRVIENVIEEGIEIGAFRKVNARLTTLAAFGMWFWTYQWHRPEGEAGQEDLAEFCTDLLFNGLLPACG